MSVEEPPFRLQLREGRCEVRDYPALVVAEVVVGGGQNQASSAGFGILASYIFGANARREKIAMTAPVTLIPMPGKVGSVAARGADAWAVRFTMPKGFSTTALPPPKDGRIRLRADPPTRFAVICFSGLAQPHVFTSRTAELNAWVAARHLRANGPASLAQYDPPWTPWFLRRNEVMIPLAA